MEADLRVATGIDVSRETIEKLRAFEAEVVRWTPSINLVSRHQRNQVWDRHVIDSAQIVSLVSEWPAVWLDIGSGGGFPGIVIAIMAQQLAPQSMVRMVESDQRKCAFLRQTLRKLDLQADVIANRIEELPPQNAGFMTARALAPLERLLPFVERHLDPKGTALLMKGKQWRQEVEAARADWTFQLQPHRSKTDPDAAILEIKDLKRA